MASFWRVLRLVFVIFSLYLLADAVYRWSSFKHHSSFAEFLPSVALITLLWSIVAVLTTIVLWIPLRSIEWASQHIFKTDKFILFTRIFLVCGLIVWQGKKIIWTFTPISFQMKLVIFACVLTLSIFFTCLYRSKVQRLIAYVQNQITPLVWLCGIWVLFSIPLVAYNAKIKESGRTVLKAPSIAVNAEKSRPNIILFTFDGLTARDMSVYGYERETTPFIRKWAEKASVFTSAKAEGDSTVTSVASLMTGKRPWTHRIAEVSEVNNRNDIESLPHLLKTVGYFNMAFSVNANATVRGMGMFNSFMVAPSWYELVSPASLFAYLRLNLYRVFSTKIKLYDWILYEDFILSWNTPGYFKYPNIILTPTNKVLDMFMAEFNNKVREPYFAWIHVDSPQFPGIAKRYSGLFDSSQKFRSPETQFDLIHARYFTDDQQPDADILRARYDELIRECDDEFKDFIERLSKSDHLSPPVIILSADHGESFQHGYFAHGGPFLFEQMIHIPLIIKEPGQKEGNIFNIPVEQIDTSATILDFAGISVPSWAEGRSLIPLLQGKKLQSMPIFSMEITQYSITGEITDGVIAVSEGNYKFIHYLKEEKSQLFNLRDDPEELDNLFEKKPVVGNNFLELIQDNLKKANKRILNNR